MRQLLQFGKVNIFARRDNRCKLVSVIVLLFLIHLKLDGLNSSIRKTTNQNRFLRSTGVLLRPSLISKDADKHNVSALIFYGRRRYVEILNCYLEQNLIQNGGLLSEVIFVSKTNNKDDILYLNDLVKKHPNVYFVKNDSDLGWTFHIHYQNLNPNRYYVKIDDDVVYIHQNTIMSMLKAKLSNPDVLFISANVINHPVLGILHLHLRALLNSTTYLALGEDGTFPNFDWMKSACANLNHHSFLKRSAQKNLDAFMFATWDFNVFAYARWSINFILFKGHEVQDVGPGDDEHQISIVIPKKYRKHSIAVGEALVVHFAYGPQRQDDLKELGFLLQYKRLAKKVCYENTVRRKNFYN